MPCLLTAFLVLQPSALVAQGTETAGLAPGLSIYVFVAGAAAAFAVLHAFLYVFFPRARGNLYYALFAALVAVFFLAIVRVNQPGDPDQVELWSRILASCGMAMALAGIRFELSVFELKTSFYFRLLSLAVFTIIVLIWVQPAWFSRYWVNVLGLFLCVEMLRPVLKAIVRRQRDAWVIGLGFLAFALAGLLETANILEWIDGVSRLLVPAGIVALVVSMSVYLSKTVARTNRDLERQLEEVRRLDAQAREQERRAYETEMSRRLLEAENQAHVAELEEARRLQLSMLPGSRPRLPNVEVAFRSWTASEVGGDYYDYRLGEDGVLTLAIGDATGHGLNSGLMVASTKSLFQSGDQTASLPAVLERISRGIKSMNLERMNFAMLVARIEGHAVRLASAGMPPALVARADGDEVEELLIPGPPLGTMVGFPYQEARLALSAGDTMLLMTDGLPEIQSPAGELLGYEKTRELFGRVADEPLDDILEYLYEAANRFADGHPQEDDLTLIAVRAR